MGAAEEALGEVDLPPAAGLSKAGGGLAPGDSTCRACSALSDDIITSYYVEVCMEGCMRGYIIRSFPLFPSDGVGHPIRAPPPTASSPSAPGAGLPSAPS
jgi:hypothetical protein